MAHFAKVSDGIVVQVIVAELDFFDSFIDTSPGEWIQCSYNTQAGVHNLGGTPLRKNFPSVGFIYDSIRDAFYEPQPAPSWTLNETTCFWEPPVIHPGDGQRYNWNEETTAWVLVE